MSWLLLPPAMTEAEVERRIAYWHQGGPDVGDMPLWAYLGWTPFVYADWVETGDLPGPTDKELEGLPGVRRRSEACARCWPTNREGSAR